MTPNKIKIVVAVNILDIGGAERTVQTLALYLNKEKFDVSVLCMLRGGSRVKFLEENGCKVFIGDGSISKIKELIPKPDVDILHFHRSGQFEKLHEEVVGYLRPKKLMETNVFAFSDAVLGPKFDLQIYKSMMMLGERVWQGKEKEFQASLRQRVIYNPVTVDYFDQFVLSLEEKESLRSKIAVRPDEILVGRIGRNDPVKWGDLILSALPEIFKTNNKIKILFRTVPTSRLKWLKNNNFFNGRVIVMPETSSEKEIAETYQMLDVYLHTSRRGEAFGNSLNEAMVWSLPIIVENTPHWDNGQLEQVDNGKTGWVVNSASGLVEALTNLLENPDRLKDFGQAGRKKVLNSFGCEKGIGQYELAYNQLVGIKSESEVLKEAFPSVDSLINYHKYYKEMKYFDFPHSTNIFLEMRKKFQYWMWRVLDSLLSRGYIKL